MASGTNISSGRRGYLRYQYGTHYWIPTVEGSWTRGIIRDTARVQIPPGGLYDATDFLFHQPGVAQKRGGTANAGPVMSDATVAPYRAAALALSPSMYLEFDEVAGSSTVADASGNSNTGTVVAGVTLGVNGVIPGGSGTAAQFVGYTGSGGGIPSSNRVTVADATSLNPTTSLSVAFWCNTFPVATSSSPQYCVLHKGSLEIRLQESADGVDYLIYAFTDSAGHAVQVAFHQDSFQPFGTRFFVLTDDGTTIKVYADGTLCNTQLRSGLGATSGFSGISGNTLYVGSNSAGQNQFYGVLDELAVYKNVALSAADVTTLWGDRLTSGQATFAQAVAHVEFPAGSQLVGLGDNDSLFQITSGATTALNGQTVGGGCVDKPKLRVGGTQHLLVVPCADGTSVPVVYDGSAAPVSLGGTPPAFKFCEIYRGYLVGANNNSNPNRIFFSPALDITSTWDTADSWIDTSHEIVGLAALQSALLVFSKGHVEKITGTTPPPNTDMTLTPIGDEGCLDARSIVVDGDTCIYANSRGVWLTNGIGFQSLTAAGGIETYWRELLAEYDSSWSIAGGLFGNFYLVTIIDADGVSTTLMCNIPTRAWWPLSNFNAVMYARGVGAGEELYYADSKLPRVVQVSGIFTPDATNELDANGNPVEPMLETRALGDGPDLKAVGGGHVLFDMRDADGDSPTMGVEFARGTEATTFAAVPESPLVETTDAERRRFVIGGDSQAVTVRLQQYGGTSKTEVYALEVELRPYPAAAEGQ